MSDQEEILAELRAVRSELAEFTAMKQDLQDIANAWKAASWFVGLIKLLGGMATAALAIWGALKLFKGA